MAAEFPLKLTITAVDKATASLRDINKRMSAFTAPVRKLNNSMVALSAEAGIPRLMKGFAGVGSAVGNVGKEAGALGLKLAGIATGAGVAFYAIVKGAVDAGDKLGEMAQRVGLGVDTYAQLQFAAAQADVEQESFNSAMDRFNKSLGEMKAGGGSFIAFLEKVNPAFARQMKATTSTEEALSLLTEGFEKVTDPGKRAALAAAAFGKSGLQMGQFLGQGTRAIREQRKRFLELAGSQEEFARGAGDLDNALRESETAFLGLRNAATGALFPALTELTRGVTTFIAANRDGIAKWAREAGAAISSWVQGGGLTRVAEGLRELVSIARTVVDALGGFKGVAIAVGLVMAGPLIGALAALVPAFITLGTAIAATPFGWFLAACAGIAAAAALIMKYWEPIKQFFVDLWGTIKGVVSSIPSAIFTDAGMEAYGFAPDGSQPLLGAAAAAPAGGAAAGQMSSAHVTVDFANVPKGVRVTADPQSTTPLDLSLGYSMASSH